MKSDKQDSENKIESLIEALGDIVRKSLRRGEDSITKKGIDKLTEVGVDFLKLKQKDEEKFKVEGKPLVGKIPQKNKSIDYIAREFAKIFLTALQNENSEVATYLVLKSSEILDEAMRGENNFFVMEQLVETRNFSGSLYHFLMKTAMEKGNDDLRSIMLQHLVAFPQRQILSPRYMPVYLDSFILYHVFKMYKLIIDKDDFRTFTDAIDQISASIQFQDPQEIIRDIDSSLYFMHPAALNPDIHSKSEKLHFMIQHDCVRDIRVLDKFLEELDEYEKMIEKILLAGKESLEGNKQRFERIRNKTRELHVTSLIYGTYFKIGQYLILKIRENPSYSKYVKELWYHTQPKFTEAQILNQTPVSNSIEWNTMYAVYRVIGSSIFDDTGIFEGFMDIESFRYQYYALLLLKLCTTSTLPDKNSIAKWVEKNEKYKTDYYYEVASNLPIEKFITALDEITPLKELLAIIRLNNITVDEKIVKTKSDLQNLSNMRLATISALELQSDVDLQKIDELKNMIIGQYERASIANKVAIVKYDDHLSGSDVKTVESAVKGNRDMFIKKDFVASFLMDSGLSDIAIKEMNYILNHIQSNVKPIQENTFDFYSQISKAITNLKNKKYKPNVIFIPLDVEMELIMKGNLAVFEHRILKIDDVDLYIVNSNKFLDFDEITVFDSQEMEITYKSQTQADKIIMEISGMEKGQPHVIVKSKLQFSIKINHVDAFTRIINQNVTELGKKP